MRTAYYYLFLLLLLVGTSGTLHAQPADSVYNKYLDYNLARLEERMPDAFKLGEEIMPAADKLPAKSQVSFYNSLGKLYEDANQLDKAQPLYEKVAAAAPDYYVVHRALGYLYLRRTNIVDDNLQAKPADKQSMAAYKAAVEKALPHLEKAEACDPSAETLALIKTLYKNTNNSKGLSSLNARLKQLGKNCVTLLDEN
ncbi:hypothetical protein KHS38_06305 [Mucilaginibacter sp. Bleaf8]|uniref:hypothetical protein n=1 Tax=Mucilaginibacter sp. Bleaf8 TaxID=2834430 RepID=UPI001BCB7C30|nr:hypothetical protein [Mucilaginibacter sp. Bleaf8]MBS7564012.1 hypothetical protein [Mucilaginibacter sp. Bleaf8]